jgi:hypothetical protein
LNDDLFDTCDEDFVPSDEDATSCHSQLYGQEDGDMNALRDSISDALMAMYQLVNDICYICLIVCICYL